VTFLELIDDKFGLRSIRPSVDPLGSIRPTSAPNAVVLPRVQGRCAPYISIATLKKLSSSVLPYVYILVVCLEIGNSLLCIFNDYVTYSITFRSHNCEFVSSIHAAIAQFWLMDRRTQAAFLITVGLSKLLNQLPVSKSVWTISTSSIGLLDCHTILLDQLYAYQHFTAG